MVAKRLGMSERTLARRLSEEGVTFIEVVQQLKATLARYYLEEETMPISKSLGSWASRSRAPSAMLASVGRASRQANCEEPNERWVRRVRSWNVDLQFVGAGPEIALAECSHSAARSRFPTLQRAQSAECRKVIGNRTILMPVVPSGPPCAQGDREFVTEGPPWPPGTLRGYCPKGNPSRAGGKAAQLRQHRRPTGPATRTLAKKAA